MLGNRDTRIRFIKEYRNKFKKLYKVIRQRKIKAEKEKFIKSFIENLNNIKSNKSKDMVFLFSGTTFVQEKRGNRPIRLTNAWTAMGIPVIFSYYRWNIYEDIPKNTQENLYQLPIDYTLEIMDKLIEYDFGDKNKVFIVSFPYPELVRYISKLQLNGWKVIYDVRDNWEEFHKVGMAKWYNESSEKFFVANSDVVCAVAKPLVDKMQQYTENKKILLSPNALDEKFLNYCKGDKQRKENNTIKIGYVGHLSSGWFDWESLIKIAKTRSNWIFEIIGHFEPKGMILPNNVVLLGSKTHDEIKDYAQHWNVAIIPFKISKLSDCVDPIKVYEYLAMGLPVVSFRMPQIHDYPYVFIANNSDEFILKIEEAISTDVDYDKVLSFLHRNTWRIRAKEIINYTNEIRTYSHFI
ncbi:glycosyltransferase [Caminicella sporogenes]|uniref:glycosyltransferase n=1 Tax=Caminicella sporogenes TaxID=166485 RepID=UPI00253FDD89|nr:glycosyltransferase [Caminicella sporogenes]WIF96092.1 glycosyltransferase [Caminicella sporogenes]